MALEISPIFISLKFFGNMPNIFFFLDIYFLLHTFLVFNNRLGEMKLNKYESKQIFIIEFNQSSNLWQPTIYQWLRGRTNNNKIYTQKFARNFVENI